MVCSVSDFKPIHLFTAIGVLVSVLQAKNLLNFVWFHFFRPATYQLYLQGPDPYALVTGATDGIGKSLAKDLYSKGFNLILHGRNEEKMRLVVKELKAQNKDGGDIKVFFVDGSRPDLDFEGMVKEFEGLNITLVINNAGGSGVRPSTTDGWPEEDLLKIIRLNAIFPTLLTRALLPSLRKTALKRPVLVTFIGSYSSTLDVPRICVYAGSKAYINRLSRTLHADERFDSPNSKLAFMVVETAEVNSNTMNKPVSWICPSSDEYAKLVVKSLGCGKKTVTPHLGHAVSGAFVTCVPERILDGILRAEMKEVVEVYVKKA